MQRFMDKHIGKIVDVPREEFHRLKLLKVIKVLMKFYQVWPDDNKTLVSRLRFFFFMVFCNIIVAGSLGHFIVQIVYEEERVFGLMIYDVSILLGGFAGYHFIPTFFAGQHRTKILLDALGDFSVFDKPDRIEIEEAIMNGVCKLYYIIVYSLAPLVFVVKFFQSCPDERDMLCGFLFPAYYPGMMTPIRRKIVITLQVCSLFNYTLFGFGCLWFFLQMSNIICLYLKKLHHILEDLVEIHDWTQRRNRALYAVKYHHHIIDLYNEFFNRCKGIFIIYAVWIPVIMGVMTYTLTVEFDVQFFAVYVLWATALCITCLFGQNMITESEKVASIAYMSTPTDGDMITAKILAMMIMRSQRPLFVPAGSLTYCGYSLIVTVAQTTYSYLTLLKTTNRN